MEATWFVLLSLMLVVYVVLDGFDFGAGIVHHYVARTEHERRTVLGAIGPVWDGNEVWLVASGGLLFFAFPKAYAASLSGLYLGIMFVIWLLILRGISIEFRSSVANPLWRTFWDGTFTLASALLSVILGVALGNLLRGIPLDESGYFQEDLFTNFRISRPGIIDWYTALVGAFALAALAGHGAAYLYWKTEGPVQARSKDATIRMWILATVLGLLLTLATSWALPHHFAKFLARPWLWVLPAFALASLVMIFRSVRRGHELRAFLASSGVLASMLLATAGVLFPTILRSTLEDRYSLDAYNASSGRSGLALGLAWWIPAILLAIGYFVYLFRAFRGKVKTSDHHGY